jgi:hypothetical protein
MSTTMLYKAPGPHAIHGGFFDHCIVPDEEIERAKSEGWFLTTPEAKAAHEAATAAAAAPVSSTPAAPAPKLIEERTARDDLEARARALGIGFNSRTSDKNLAKAIEDAQAVTAGA